MSVVYRFYRLEAGCLVSPFAGLPLPDDGVDVAECCTRLICPHGISVYGSREDMHRAAQAFGLPNDEHVITVGEAHGPIRPDTRRQLYTDLDGVAIAGPPAQRCNSFRVTTILASRPITLAYSVPVIVGTLEDLPCG